MRINALLAFVALNVVAASTPAWTAELPPPRETVILTVSGAITVKNSPDGARFDQPMLERLGVATIRSTTPWTDGVTEFEGVPAKAVLEAVGASGTTVVANAINDYQSRIPLSDFTDYAVLLAFKVNGKILTRRDKGPLWIVYPMDDHPPKFRSIWSNRSVWQMNELVVE